VDPDLPLMQALQAGDDSALNELMRRHREALFHFIFRYLRDETAATDVVQETFVRVYFKARHFTPQALVKTWLYAVALNVARDEARRLAKRQRFAPPDARTAPLLDQAADPASIPSEQAGQADEFQQLQDAIARLPENLREALVLFSLEGKSQKEAAQILATSPKTVELRVYRAKQKLREWLGLTER
jgi:RNA polymerase sigma-70 factor (ECF subfamily)